MVRKYNIYVGDGNFATIHNSGIEMYKNHLSYYTNLYSMKNNPFQALCLLYQWHCFLSYFPPHMWFHLVFHVLNLEPYDLNSIPCCDVPPQPSIELDEGLEFKVKTILDSKVVCNTLYYLLIDYIINLQIKHGDILRI